MATINIGNLAFTHKGDYASGTAYVKNDVVYYSTNGNAYIAKQATTGNAPTNATYWNQFAQGSGGIWNAGLSLGSASQVVKVNAAGNALEFGTLSSDYVKLAHTETSSDVSSITMSNVFSTSYDIFECNIEFSLDTTTQLQMEYEQSGGSFRQSGYYFNSNMATRGSPSSNISTQGDLNYANFRAHENQSSDAAHRALWNIKYVRPSENNYTRWQHHLSMWDGTYMRELVGGGFNSASEVHTGVRFSTTSGNIRSGSSVTIYGLKGA